MKGPSHHGARRKHVSAKHHGTSKHHSGGVRHKTRRHHAAPVAVGHHPHHPKPRRLTPDGSVALCSARAVAESLRLALGVSVSDEDVLGLYWRTASDPDAGATILATLEAAAEYGLAGVRPAFAEVGRPDGFRVPHFLAALGRPWGPAASEGSLLLGLELPEGPHAIYQSLTVSGTPFDARSCWWSWGEPYDPDDFPGAVIEEAWAVTWQ